MFVTGKKGYSGTYCHHSGCKDVHNCLNNRCYWRRRDALGMNPWWVPDENAPCNVRNREIVEKYGDCYFPKIKCHTSTNDMIMYCEDFIPTEEFRKKQGLQNESIGEIPGIAQNT